MKKLTLTFCAAFSAIAAHGATVNWGDTGQQTGFADSSTAALAVGNWIRIGYFPISDALISAGLSTPSTLNTSFQEFGSIQIGTGTGGFAGTFQGTAVLNYVANPSFTGANQQIYIWALKATDNTSVSTALSTVTEQAIFYAPKATFTNWIFPATDGATAPTVDIGDPKASGTYLAGSYVASNAALTSIYNGAGISGTIGAVQLQTVAAVPEPSTVAFGALAALAAAGVRRRRRE